jgi:hypothetical protein
MKKIVVAAIAASSVFVLAGCALLYPNWGTDQNPSTSQSASPSESTSTIESPSPTASPSKILGKADVKLFDAGFDKTGPKLFAMADVANFAENGGYCTLTFVGGGVTKSVKVTAEANVQRTQCALMEISAAGLPKGAGILTVEYFSENYYGAAPSAPVTIP